MTEKEPITIEDINEVFGAYGKEDYLVSEEPYTVLIEAVDGLSRMKRNIIINAVQNMAKKAGCSYQKFNEMLESAGELRSGVIPDSGGFPGIQELLNGSTPDYDEYLCSGKGVFLYDEKSRKYIEVCPHPIFLTRRYVNAETEDEMLDLSYYRDGQWKTRKMVPRMTLIKADQITSLGRIGLGITSENARDMVKYLSCIYEKNRSIIPAVETTGRMGWLGDRGFVPYLPDVIYDDENNYSEMFNAIHKEGDPQEWVNLARAVRANKENPAGKFVLAASVASVVLPLTCNQSFFVHLWSPVSGTGKTLALMLAASVWADPTMGKYLKPLNSTDAALEQMENFCNNLPLCLDELESVQSKDNNGTVYRLSEGMGKSRATKTLGLRQQTHWLNIIITNGEHPITDDSKGGSMNRVISIESTGQLLPGGDTALSEAAEKMMHHFGHAGEMIIKTICSSPAWKETIRNLYREYRARLLKKATGKQASYGAALMVGDWLLENIVTQDDHCITPEEILAVLATPEMTDINLRAQRIVRDFVAVNSNCFLRDDNLQEVPRGQIYGKMTGSGKVYIIQNTLQQVLDAANINFTAFMKWCLKKNLIHTNFDGNNERHWGIVTRLQGLENPVRAICFEADFFSSVDRESQMTIVETDADNPFSSGSPAVSPKTA